MHKRTPPHLLFRYQSCGHSLNLNDPHDLYELSIDFCYFAISHNTPLLTNWSSLHHLVTFRFFDLYFRLYIYIYVTPLYMFYPSGLVSIFATTRYLNRNVFDGALRRMYAAIFFSSSFFVFYFCVRDFTLRGIFLMKYSERRRPYTGYINASWLLKPEAAAWNEDFIGYRCGGRNCGHDGFFWVCGAILVSKACCMYFWVLSWIHMPFFLLKKKKKIRNSEPVPSTE